MDTYREMEGNNKLSVSAKVEWTSNLKKRVSLNKNQKRFSIRKAVICRVEQHKALSNVSLFLFYLRVNGKLNLKINYQY